MCSTFSKLSFFLPCLPRREKEGTVPLTSSLNDPTITLSASTDPRRKLQNQSPLFQLPPELRCIIWRYVAGTRTIKITRRRPGVVIRENHRFMRYLRSDLPLTPDDVPAWEAGALLSCRKVYHEFLPVLLEAVRLQVDDIFSLKLMLETLPKYHTLRITHLTLHWFVSSAPHFLNGGRDEFGNELYFIRKPYRKRYQKKVVERAKAVERSLRYACEALESMDGLESVAITIYTGRAEEWKAVDPEVLDMVNKARKGRRGWKLTVFWGPKGDREVPDQEGLCLYRREC